VFVSETGNIDVTYKSCFIELEHVGRSTTHKEVARKSNTLPNNKVAVQK
jgi:hypothetical protein